LVTLLLSESIASAHIYNSSGFPVRLTQSSCKAAPPINLTLKAGYTIQQSYP